MRLYIASYLNYAMKRLIFLRDKLQNKLIERRYKEQELNESIERTKIFDIQKLLKEKTKKRSNRVHYLLQRKQQPIMDFASLNPEN